MSSTTMPRSSRRSLERASESHACPSRRTARCGASTTTSRRSSQMARERTAWRSPDERAVPAVAVILVRHGMPEIQRGVASTRWRLSEAAKEDCVLLAHALPAELGPVVYSSAQAKAQETATVIALRRGLRTEVDERLREVEQPP